MSFEYTLHKSCILLVFLWHELTWQFFLLEHFLPILPFSFPNSLVLFTAFATQDLTGQCIHSVAVLAAAQGLNFKHFPALAERANLNIVPKTATKSSRLNRPLGSQLYSRKRLDLNFASSLFSNDNIFHYIE